MDMQYLSGARVALDALDPLDRVYAPRAGRAAAEPRTPDASIHSPLHAAHPAPPNEPAPAFLRPQLALAVVIVASDGVVFRSAWIGDTERLFSWTPTDDGILVSEPAGLDVICGLLGEQATGTWVAERETAVAAHIVTITALWLDGDRVRAGLHREFEQGAEMPRSPAELADGLAAEIRDLGSAEEDGGLVLVLTHGPDGETWDVDTDMGDDHESQFERLQDLRSSCLTEISVEVDGHMVVIATGPRGTAVVTEQSDGRVRVWESRRGALAEVEEITRGYEFGEVAGTGDIEAAAQLLADDEWNGSIIVSDPRELILTITRQLGERSVETQRLLFVDAEDGCYHVALPAEPDGPDADAHPDLPTTPVERRGIVALASAALRRPPQDRLPDSGAASGA
jgi:hypothetical protein